MAEIERTSVSLPDADIADYSPAIESAIDELRRIIEPQEVRLVQWHQYGIGVAIIVRVNLPARGPVGDVDIRTEEPVVIVFNKVRYPYQAPTVFIDRTGFPAEQLPHLYPAQRRMPPALCLHRGHVADWFAEHSISELVQRIQSWFEDAAGNRLTRQQDFFEPTRLEINEQVGVAIYDPKRLEEFVRQQWRIDSKSGYAVLLCSPPSRSGAALSTAIGEVHAASILDSFGRAPKTAKQKVLGVNLTDARQSVGLLAYPKPDRLHTRYLASLPDDMGGLYALANQLGLPLKQAVQHYLKASLSQPHAIPVIMVIQRPRPLIGTNSPIELLNFMIRIGESPTSTAQRWGNHTPVSVLAQVRPATVRLAKELSQLDAGPVAPETRGMVIGCGALGSKVALHLARAGHTQQSLVDNDTFAPHNVLRHGLLSGRLGENKAEATGDAIKEIFLWDQGGVQIQAIPQSAYEVLFQADGRALRDRNWILDCSASVSVLNALIDPRLSQLARVMRSEIADRGRLGFLLVEGADRNPRLDDLQATLYDHGIDDDRIAMWLISQRDDTELDVGPALEEISIGLGCSSDTMRMADDMVSYHAAATSIAVRHVLERSAAVSGIQISDWDNAHVSSGHVEFVDVGRYRMLPATYSRDWYIRMPEGLFAKLQEEMEAVRPKETGGLLVGFIHPKRKIIYITRSLPPPPDSEGWPYAFRIGTQDVPELLEHISDRTGGLVRYVGEWHSHPGGPSQMSAADLDAARQISRHLRGKQPTHIMVVTPDGCYPHVLFEDR